MPRKKVSKKKSVAKTSSSKAVVSWKDRLSQLAAQESDRQTVIGGGSNAIKLSKGSFKYQGEDLGESLQVVVVDFVKHKNWYDRPFDEDNPSPPACFALSADGKNMIPHATAPEPQAETCAECWANEFESDNRGKGKACRDSYLLCCISADQLGEDEPEVAYLRVPPTSLAAWDSFMVKRNKVLNLPALAFVVEVTFDDTVDYQKILFEEVGRTGEGHWEALFQLHDTAHELMLTPPDVSNYEPPTSKKKKTKKKAATKKKSKVRKSRFG